MSRKWVYNERGALLGYRERSAQPPSDALRAVLAGRAYEAAKQTRVTKRAWGGLGDRTIDADLLGALATLRARCRHEYHHSGYVRGVVQTYVEDLLGEDGPTLQIVSEDDDWSSAVERWWEQWCERADATGRQHLADLSAMQARTLFWAGEFFEQLVSARDDSFPATLRLLPISAARICSPYGVLDAQLRDGVRVDPNGRPLAYYVLRRHPGDLLPPAGLRLDDYIEVPARDMRHVLVIEEPEQTRGEPWLTCTLELVMHLRQFTADTMLAARVAAMLSGFIYTDSQQISAEDLSGDLPIWDMEPASISTLPAGWKFAQTDPKQPATTFPQFKTEQLREFGRPFGMPYLKVAADAANHNYSSARLDLQCYWRGIAARQSWLGRMRYTPLVRAIVQELWLSGALPPPPRSGWRVTWHWPTQPAIDALKETEAQQLALAAGLTTLSRESKQLRMDWRELLAQRARENALAAELGLPPVGALSGAAALRTQEQDDEQDA